MSNSKKDLEVVGRELTKLQLVIEDDKTLVANTAPIKEFVSALEVHFKEKQNEIDLEKFEEAYTKQVLIFNNFDTYRKGALSSIASIPKQVTGIMNTEWQGILDNWKNEIEDRKEKFYILADKNIKTVLTELLESESEEVKAQLDLRIFDTEFNKMRKTSYAQLTEKGKIKKSLSDKIEVLFNDAVQPIRDRVALEEQKEREQKNFEIMLDKYSLDGDIDALNKVIIELENFKLQVPTMFVTIEPMAIRSINNKVDNAKTKIRAIESEKKRLEAEQAQEALKNADKDVLLKVDAIESNLSLIENDKDVLLEKIEELQLLGTSVKFADNRVKITNLINKLKVFVATIEAREKAGEVLEVSQVEDEIVEDIATPFDAPIIEEDEPKTEEKDPNEILSVDFNAIGKRSDIKMLLAFAEEHNINLETI